MRANKRFAALVLVIVSMLLILPTSLAEGWVLVSVEQCHTVMPEIDVYFYLQDGEGNSIDADASQIQEIGASLGNKKLDVGSFRSFEGATAYFFIVDISGSISGKLFEQIKSGLLAWIATMPDSDRLVLVTMGETASIALDGTESRDTAKATVSSLEAEDKLTVFHESLAKAIELAGSGRFHEIRRKVSIVITDGINKSGTAGGISLSELSKMLATAELPLFALGVGSDAQSLTALGELARSSGGSYKQTDRAQVFGDLESLRVHIDSCLHLQLNAQSNVISGQTETLSLQFVLNDGSTVNATVEVAVTQSIPDKDAPLAAVEVRPENKSFIITFSEAVNGGETPENYTLRDNAGAVVPIASVIYDSAKNTAELIPDAVLYNGSYTLELHGIVDVSMEKNTAVFASGSSVTIQATSGTDGKPTDAQTPDNLQKDPVSLWWIIAIVIITLAAIIAIVVYAASKRKKADAKKEETASAHGTSVYEEQFHFKKQDGMHVTLSILNPKGLQRDLSVFVADSLIIGRSESSCDVSIEDKELSRQHCALIYQDDILFIQDLSSTNGTLVNGSRIIGSRPLSDGDAISIGNTKILVRM